MRLLLAMSESSTARMEEPLQEGRGQDDLDSMLRGVFSVPRRFCASCYSRQFWQHTLHTLCNYLTSLLASK
eukprot:symbB.v1.2.039049.t1/scaffold6315.1/size19090/3